MGPCLTKTQEEKSSKGCHVSLTIIFEDQQLRKLQNPFSLSFDLFAIASHEDWDAIRFMYVEA